jgi:hypothetical protein
MTATGIVEPVREWDEGADGRRRPSERQARDEGTGMPLWGVEVLYVQSTFGRLATVTARVTVGAVERPGLAALSPIGFAGLVVEVRTNKAGGLVESWSAEAVAHSVPAGAGPGDGQRPGEGRSGAKPSASTTASAAASAA